MEQQEVIEQTAAYVKRTLEGDGSGHDWWHIQRVRNTAMHIAEMEKADDCVVELAALLHDIADWKFHEGDINKGPQVARKWLKSLGVTEEVIGHVCDIIKNLSFKGAGVETPMATLEGKIVQDADRLDGIGAIGIARAFAYGGHKGRELHNPDVKPVQHADFEAYKNSTSTTINHFYEKLLLLKERMNTETAKQIANKRHAYMVDFLEEFESEWKGKA